MGVAFGRYELDRWLAQGGMANIFLATYGGPLGFEREVVLKVILPEFAHHPAFITMFLDEARLAARLSHPNIVQVFDLGRVSSYIYLAMEYVRGASMSRLLARLKREQRFLSPGLAIFIISELLEALAYAHARRDRDGTPLSIVHRDVTPQNVLVSFDGQIKLTDFGVARARTNLHQNQPGAIIGKYSHMAPEQCLGLHVDERADLFSVGIMLHELLTGKPLFVRPTQAEMRRAILEEPIPLPSQLQSRCPPELDLVVMKSLARRPDERYPNALAFLDAIHRVTRPLHLMESKYDLRNVLTSLYRKGRTNLAGEDEPGVPVTEDRISEILKGLHHGRHERSEHGRSHHSTTNAQRSVPGKVGGQGTERGAASKSQPPALPFDPEVFIPPRLPGRAGGPERGQAQLPFSDPAVSQSSPQNIFGELPDESRPPDGVEDEEDTINVELPSELTGEHSLEWGDVGDDLELE